MPLTVAVLCSQTQDFLRRYFFSVNRPKVSFAIDGIRYVGQNVAILALINWFPANGASALWLVSAVAAVGSLAALPCIPQLKYSFSAFLSVSLHGWHFSKWLFASTLVVAAFNNLFYFASGILLGVGAVGAMKAAFTMVSIANVVIEACVNVIPASASRKFMSNGRRGLIAYLLKVTIYGTVAIVSLLGVVVIAPKFWLHFFFGPQFSSYWTLVQWYAAYEILLFLAMVVGTWYRTLERTRLIFYAVSFSVIVSITVAYPLIVNFGVAGAVVGLALGQLAQTLFMLVYAAWR